MTEQQAQHFSLAALSEINTDELATLTSRIPAAGIYTVLGMDARFVEGEAKDGKPPLHRIVFETEILHADLIDDTIDAEALVNRKLNDSTTLWADSIMDCLGLIKGDFKKAGIEYSGQWIDSEGNLGWMKNVIGAKFGLKVRHGTRKDGDAVAYIDWIPLPEVE